MRRGKSRRKRRRRRGEEKKGEEEKKEEVKKVEVDEEDGLAGKGEEAVIKVEEVGIIRGGGRRVGGGGS